MILAITRENEKIIYEVCNEFRDDSPNVVTGVESLKRFAIQELKNLNNYTDIIIDITTTKESEDDIIQSVVAIKTMYNVRVIIVAFGFKEGNSLLSKLFNEGIYNFVNADNYFEQKEQFRNCLSDEGCQYKDAIRFRQKIEMGKKNKIVIKKEYKKLKQFVNIAVVGTETHIGTTTQALLITMFLKSLNMNACYICANSKNEISQLEPLQGVIKKGDMLNYKGIDLYTNDNKIDALKYGYDFYVYDYGVLNEESFENFLSKEVKIVVGGTKAWEMDSIFRCVTQLEKIPDVNYILNFSSNDEKIAFNKYLKNQKNVFFSEYTTDSFNDNVNIKTYHKIFKDYIAEKSNKIEVIEKKGIFDFFRKGSR